MRQGHGSLILAAGILATLRLATAEQIPLGTVQDDSKVNIIVFPTIDQPCWSDGNTRPIPMAVAPGVCLSSDHSWDDTVKLETLGHCPAGITPYVAFYQSPDCTGEHTHPKYWDVTARTPQPKSSRCLANGVWNGWNRKIRGEPKGPWSMVVRCLPAEQARDAQGGSEIVKMPTRPRAAWRDELLQMHLATDARIADGVCGVPNYKGYGDREAVVEPDKCTMIAPRGRMEIREAAVCPNGTRAMLATWHGTICKGEVASLREVTDDMLDTCIDVGYERWGAFAFWCTGHPYGYPRSAKPRKYGSMN